MVDSIAESARKASAGTWRKPRVRIYDYNQVSPFFEPFTFSSVQVYEYETAKSIFSLSEPLFDLVMFEHL